MFLGFRDFLNDKLPELATEPDHVSGNVGLQELRETILRLDPAVASSKAHYVSLSYASRTRNVEEPWARFEAKSLEMASP